MADLKDLVYGVDKSFLKSLIENNAFITTIGCDGHHFLRLWLTCRPYDFQDRKLLTLVADFCTLTNDNRLKLLLLRICKSGVSTRVNINMEPIDVNEGLGSVNIWKAFVSKDKRELARWLTSRTAIIYAKIDPSELIEAKWSTEGSNLGLMQRRFDQISKWFVTLILLVRSREEQLLIVTEILRIGMELYKMNNFHDLGAILASLNNFNISRLKYLFEALGKGEKSFFEKLEVTLSPISNYREYRRYTAKGIVSRTIPYTPVHLKDMESYIKGCGGTDPYVTGSLVRSYLKYQVLWYQGSLEIEFRHYKPVIAFISDEEMERVSDEWQSSKVLRRSVGGVRRDSVIELSPRRRKSTGSIELHDVILKTEKGKC